MKIEFFIGHLEQKSLSKWISENPKSWNECNPGSKLPHEGAAIIHPIRGNEFMVDFDHHPLCAEALTKIVLTIQNNSYVRLFYNREENVFYFSTPMSVDEIYAITKHICGTLNFNQTK